MVKLSGQLPLVLDICLEDIRPAHPCNYLLRSRYPVTESIGGGYWSFVSRTEGNHRFHHPVPWSVEYKCFDFEQLSITVQVPRDGKMIRTATIRLHICLEDIRQHIRVQLSVAVRVPRWPESIGVLQLIVVSFGQKVITGFVVSWTVIQLNTSALIWTTIDHRPGPRDGEIIRTALPFVFTSVEDIRQNIGAIYLLRSRYPGWLNQSVVL